jgi:hypothetical protein
MVRKKNPNTLDVLDVREAVGNVQRALDSRDYNAALLIRDRVVRKFLNEVLHGHQSKYDMSEMASLILAIDDQAPFKPYGA